MDSCRGVGRGAYTKKIQEDGGMAVYDSAGTCPARRTGEDYGSARPARRTGEDYN